MQKTIVVYLIIRVFAQIMLDWVCVQHFHLDQELMLQIICVNEEGRTMNHNLLC